ncbi:hypothetical protein QDR63_01370 [Acinetobacter baumannii]|uniref:hypothetical protein n=1 Tax=Acinetobacter baumannii TaxID=470 RepID=UPI00244A7929|nr:hypothetical protein [Acinetobacter baumannii]MDH2524947.1 hypothetical protein [Acinetobacter baumannii]
MSINTQFIKPSHKIFGVESFNSNLVEINKIRGIETTLFLDSNILIRMENIVDNGNSLELIKYHGLYDLIAIIRECPPESICLAPGVAFAEMPPQMANISKRKYEQFLTKHLPYFIDAPGSINRDYHNYFEIYGFEHLPRERQAILVVNYLSLIYLNIIYNNYSKLKPIEKFKLFIDVLEDKIDVLSSTIIEIARYCFAIPPAQSKNIIKTCKKVRMNFAKTTDGKLPRSDEDYKHIAFNGACDINLLFTANTLEQKGLDGIQQDCWIATQDIKLAEFCNVFHHINIAGEVGKYSASSFDNQMQKDLYWINSHNYHIEKLLGRIEYTSLRKVNYDKLIALALTDVFILGKQV